MALGAIGQAHASAVNGGDFSVFVANTVATLGQ